MSEAGSQVSFSQEERRQPVFPSFQWWHGMILGVGLTYEPGSLLLMGILLSPLMALRVLDVHADRQRLVIMLFYVGAVMVHPLHQAWEVHGDWQRCLDMLWHPTLLALDWFSLAFAWFVAEISAMVSRLWCVQKVKAERHRLERRIQDLEEEWISS